MPKLHGATLGATLVFVVLILVAYHFTLGRKR